MSQLIQSNLPCFHCKPDSYHSREHMAEYENNFFCFATNQSFPKSGWYKALETQTERKNLIELSPDHLPKEAYIWLSRWLTKEEIRQHKFSWCNNNERIIMPVGNGIHQLRSLNKDIKTKVLTYNPDHVKNLMKSFRKGDGTKTCVIVEDMVSAIVVSRVVDSVAFLGTAVNKEKVNRLLNFYHKDFIIWMDGDEPGIKASKRLCEVLSQVANVIKVIKTDKDPKYYGKKEIEGIIK